MDLDLLLPVGPQNQCSEICQMGMEGNRQATTLQEEVQRDLFHWRQTWSSFKYNADLFVSELQLMELELCLLVMDLNPTVMEPSPMAREANTVLLLVELEVNPMVTAERIEVRRPKSQKGLAPCLLVKVPKLLALGLEECHRARVPMVLICTMVRASRVEFSLHNNPVLPQRKVQLNKDSLKEKATNSHSSSLKQLQHPQRCFPLDPRLNQP
ncbi:uncharacterized protein ACB058_002513 [Synchiropus picturatus]